MRTLADGIGVASEKTGSSICCGLDVDMDRIPSEFAAGEDGDRVLGFLEEIVAMTVPHVCCYKVQKAFYERFGHPFLARVVEAIRNVDGNVPIILDAKVGDTANTMTAYLSIFFGEYGFDGITLNPYMGPSVWDCLDAWPGRGGVVLVRTSGEASDVFQKAVLENGDEFWFSVLKRVIESARRGVDVIPVLSSLDLDGLARGVREIPDEMPIFIAGVGAQGGAPEALRPVVGSRRVVVNGSRNLLFPFEPSDPSWRTKVLAAVDEMKNGLSAP